jgi:outer membrane lipoprotein SlyB
MAGPSNNRMVDRPWRSIKPKLARRAVGGLARSQFGGLARSQFGGLARSQCGGLVRSTAGGVLGSSKRSFFHTLSLVPYAFRLNTDADWRRVLCRALNSRAKQ